MIRDSGSLLLIGTVDKLSGKALCMFLMACLLDTTSGMRGNVLKCQKVWPKHSS